MFIKQYTAPRLALKSCLSHLTHSTLPGKKITRIISKNAKHLTYFRALNYSYSFFLKNICKRQVRFTGFTLFLFLLEKDEMYFLFDYAIFFWSKPLNILFRMEWVQKRGKPTPWIRYISSRRRLIVVWRWLALSAKLLNTLYTDITISFFFLWELFFLNPLSSSKLTSIKLRVYKIYMYKLY